MTEQAKLLLLIIGLTLASGIGDAQGFYHAATMWHDNKIVWNAFGKSALGFVVGIGAFWFASKYMTALGIVAPEMQTIIWFGITIVSVAIVSRQFLHWQRIDQVVAFLVLLGIGWLLFRTGA